MIWMHKLVTRHDGGDYHPQSIQGGIPLGQRSIPSL